MTMDHNYAREKLQALLRDLPAYTGEEFWRQMSRIAAGATGTDHAEELVAERDSLQRLADVRRSQRDALAAHVESIQDARIGLVPSSLCPLLAEAIDRSPTTSLARLRASHYREVSALLSTHGAFGFAKGIIEDAADDLCRQAEQTDTAEEAIE